MLTPAIHIETLLHVSALKWPTSGSTDTFREQSQQKTCPDVNIRIKSSVLCVTWQFSVGLLGKMDEVMLVVFCQGKYQHEKLHVKRDNRKKICI